MNIPDEPMSASKSSGYCKVCGEPTDEIGQSPLCAYHRDHPAGELAA
jgi:hypothetical protein